MGYVNTLLFSLLLFTALPVAGQKSMEHDVLITFSGLVNEHGGKVVRSTLHDLDPQALISVSVPLQQAKFRSTITLDPVTLAPLFAPHGIQVVSIERLDLDVAHRSVSQALPGFPEFIDTGDPEQDAADYAARKQTWIAAHPGLYPPVPAQPASHER